MSATVGLLGRLIYWVVVIGAALQLATLLHVVFPKLHARFGALVTRLILGAAFALAFGPFLYVFNAVFYPDRYETMMAWPHLFAFLLLIFGAIGIVMDAVSYQFTGRVTGQILVEKTDEPADVSPPELPAFAARLEPKLGTDILRLAMQDHYVEVFTSEGSQLILMRLADAIAELDGLDGLQVHRSHWVAAGHVEGVERANARVSLVMTDGARVPVSRSYRAAVKEAGLLG